MNQSEILDRITIIANTSSTKEKLELLGVAKNDTEFQRVLRYTYDPFKTYGIVALPPFTGKHAIVAQFSDRTWRLLDALAARELTGHAARAAISEEMELLSPKSAELLKRIILKDMRAGFSASSVNKVCKGLVPEFSYMRCCLLKQMKINNWEQGHISEEKADGMFANGDHEVGGLVSLRTRQGNSFPMDKFSEIADEIRKYIRPGTQTHGEMLVIKNGAVMKRKDGNALINNVIDGKGEFAADETPVYRVWDQIPLSCAVKKGCYEVPYKKRLADLEVQIPRSFDSDKLPRLAIIEYRVVYSLAEALAHNKELLAKGREGTILCKSDGIWRDGDGTEKAKIKVEAECDLRVIAINPGRDNTKNQGRPGTLTVETSDSLLRCDVAIKNEKMRDAVEADPSDWMGRIMPVIFNEVSTPTPSNELHSLMLPRLAEDQYRRDKTEADTLQRVFDQFNAAIS